MAKPDIIPLQFNGPAATGLTQLQLDADAFQSELPEQHWHIYYENESRGLTVGVWTTTSMQEAFGPYPGDEFMCILEGQAAMVDGEGNQTLIRKGESFCVRNAVPISWKQVGFLRKFFIIYNRTDGITPEISSAENGVKVLAPDELLNSMQSPGSTFPFEFDHPPSDQKAATAFVNDTGNMQVGMWESSAFESSMRPHPCSQFVQLLDGAVSISDQAGNCQDFSAGDVFFVPQGTVCSWSAASPVRKYYCNVLNQD